MCSMKQLPSYLHLYPDLWPAHACCALWAPKQPFFTTTNTTNFRLQPQGSSEWMSPKQNCNSSQEFPWAFHARNKNCAPPASETLYCWENGLWFPTALVLIEFPFIREGDRSFAEHAKIWHCLWKSRCFSPVARQIPSADREQQENSKVNSTSQGRSCSSCVFWRKKRYIHLCVCKLVCSGAFLWNLQESQSVSG